MTGSGVQPSKQIILDMGAMINLLASERIADILRVAQSPITVATYVYDEVLRLARERQIPVGSIDSIEVELDSLLRHRVLQVTDIENEDEESKIVALCVDMSDDEAVSCGLAWSRGWSLCSEDRIITTKMRRLAPRLEIITSLDLIKNWAEDKQVSASDLAQLLENIQHRTSFTPHPQHSLFSWWNTRRILLET